MTNFLIGFPDIPLRSTLAASKAEDAGHKAKNLITGGRRKRHQLASSTADDYYLQFDLGVGRTSSAEYAAIQRANLLQLNNVIAFRLRGSTQPYNLPSTIPGLKLWLDATRGITKDGSNKVSQWDDLSGEANHATQTSDANKPTWESPSSGVNGNAALAFDGSASYMTANGAAAIFSGSDKPFSVAIAFKLNNTTTAGKCYFGAGRSSSATPCQELYMANNHRAFRRDDASASSNPTGGTANTSTNVVSVVFSGTAISVYDKGSVVINAAAHDVGTMTIDRVGIGALVRNTVSEFFNGRICEICLYDSALGTSDRQALEEYLTSKWITAPSVNWQTIASDSLVGPRAEDYAFSFAASSAYRYWWAQYSASSAASKYPHSKLHFGTWFDFGRDPIYPLTQRLEAYSSGSREGRYIFECEWQGVADLKLEDFIDKIVEVKDISPVILSDAGDLCLNGMRQMHAWVTAVDIEKQTHNTNNVRCIFEEVL